MSPFDHIPQHKKNPGKVRFLTPDEEQRLMDAARLQSWVLLPLLIRLAIVTGLRRGALLGLTWGDVILDDSTPHVRIERTKNDDPHVSPLTPDLVQEFRRMRRIKAKDCDLIFTGKHLDRPHDFRHGFIEACKLAGIEGVTFHTLRHTYCSWEAQKGTPLFKIARLVGHKTTAMTERYSHLCPETESQQLIRQDNAAEQLSAILTSLAGKTSESVPQAVLDWVASLESKAPGAS